jgi:general secretion pathway protein B
MSLIHEALKKAEEQRRLGEPPGLGSGYVRQRERRSFLPVLLVAIVIAGGAGWWFTRPNGSGPELGGTNSKTATTKPAGGAASTPTASGAMAPSTQKTAESGVEHVAARSSAADHLPVPPPPVLAPGSAGLPPGGMPSLPPTASKFHPPALPAGKEPVERESAAVPAGGNTKALAQADNPMIDHSQADAVRARVKARRDADAAAAAGLKVAPVEKSAPIPMPDTGPTTRQPVAVAPPVAAPLPAPTPVPNKPKLPPAAPTPAGPGAVIASGEGETKTEPVAAATAPADATASKPNDTPMFWQLPYNLRKDLPAFNVTMHVYSADPAKRFVVINGDRKAEGDTLGTDIALREIRNDGVVLEIKGQRFLVPRGGS